MTTPIIELYHAGTPQEIHLTWVDDHGWRPSTDEEIANGNITIIEGPQTPEDDEPLPPTEAATYITMPGDDHSGPMGIRMVRQ